MVDGEVSHHADNPYSTVVKAMSMMTHRDEKTPHDCIKLQVGKLASDATSMSHTRVVVVGGPFAR
jgi:hypothetical protein